MQWLLFTTLPIHILIMKGTKVCLRMSFDFLAKEYSSLLEALSIQSKVFCTGLLIPNINMTPWLLYGETIEVRLIVVNFILSVLKVFYLLQGMFLFLAPVWILFQLACLLKVEDLFLWLFDSFVILLVTYWPLARLFWVYSYVWFSLLR